MPNKRRNKKNAIIGTMVRHVPTGTRGRVVGLHVYRDRSEQLEIEYVKGYSHEVVTMWRPKSEFRRVAA